MAVIARNAAPGTIKWTYTAGGPVYSSAAFSLGRVYVASTDGFLYSFDLTGEPSGIPQSTITNPANNGTYRNVGTSGVTLSTNGVDFDIFADLQRRRVGNLLRRRVDSQTWSWIGTLRGRT